MNTNFPFDKEKLLNLMCQTAMEAGEIIMQIYNKDFSVEYKADESPVTDADKAADTYINGVLEREYPTVARLSEETKDDRTRRQNEFCFIIDPLDGTKEFVKRNGEFTVNIGLSKNGRTIAGAVYAPTTEALYYALEGMGSFKTSKENFGTIFDENDKIGVSDRTGKLIIMRSRSHPDEKTLALFENNKDRISEIKISGSSIKGCMIAEGAADAYYRFGPTHEWDTCAMQAVVENAGGVFLQGDCSAMTYNRENTLNEKGFIILNKKENLLK